MPKGIALCWIDTPQFWCSVSSPIPPAAPAEMAVCQLVPRRRPGSGDRRVLRSSALARALLIARVMSAHSYRGLALLGLVLVTPQCTSDDASNANFTEEDCGTTVTVQLGERFAVSLASSYWQFQDLPAASPAEQVGKTTYATGKNCPTIPGSGCGILTATFESIAAGRAVISASRSTCGEALACDHGEGRDQCTIVVDVVP